MQDAGLILVHEHIMVGFVENGSLSTADYDAEDVVAAVLPHLVKLKEAGCGVLFDCAPQYLGRDPYILKRLSELSGVQLVTNTGFYKLPYLPLFVKEASEEELAAIWIKEALEGIGSSGVLAGFIKIALNDGKDIDETQLGEEHGGDIHPYHLLLSDFIPYAVTQGIEENWLRQCLTRHVFEAMSVRSP